MLLQRRRTRHAAAGRAHADPYYAHGYDPTRPVILSVAHDAADAARVAVELDRPCTLAGPAAALPLIVPDDGAPFTILAAEMAVPLRLSVTLAGPAPAGAAFRWGAAAGPLRDRSTGRWPNPAAGFCAGTPGPWVPPAPAAVTGAWADGGVVCTIGFDAPLALTGGPPDDAILIDGYAPVAAALLDPTTLRLTSAFPVTPGGSTWQVNRQPGFVYTPLVTPAGGSF